MTKNKIRLEFQIELEFRNTTKKDKQIIACLFFDIKQLKVTKE